MVLSKAEKIRGNTDDKMARRPSCCLLTQAAHFIETVSNITTLNEAGHRIRHWIRRWSVHREGTTLSHVEINASLHGIRWHLLVFSTSKKLIGKLWTTAGERSGGFHSRWSDWSERWTRARSVNGRSFVRCLENPPRTRLEGDSVVVETGLPVEGLHESVHYLDGTAGPGGRSFAMEKFEAHAGMKSFGKAPNPVLAVSSTSSPGGMILMRGDSELPTPNVSIYDHRANTGSTHTPWHEWNFRYQMIIWKIRSQSKQTDPGIAKMCHPSEYC